MKGSGWRGLAKVSRSPVHRKRNDPPRAAYARIDAPDSVLVGEEFQLIVGIGKKAQAGVIDGALLDVPKVGAYTLRVQVDAIGFGVPDDQSFEHDLRVTGAHPTPSFVLNFTTLDLRKRQKLKYRTIRVNYSVDGQPIGCASRIIAVAASESARPKHVAAQTEAVGNLKLPHGIPAADITATIRLVDDEPGLLAWTFLVRKGIKTLTAGHAVHKYLRGSPEQFASRFTGEMSHLESRPGLFSTLASSGDAIANQIPDEFWTLVRGVARELRRRPTVLLVTQEPHVPWELATFARPLLDLTAPPFLSAQVAIGRWVVGSGRPPKPSSPPPANARAKTMAVIYGDYPARSTLQPLTESAAEAQTLIESWKARPIDARLKVVLAKMVRPGADILHFSCHGNFDPRGIDDGLLMVDGVALLPAEVQKLSLRRRPFVFLNACQVGRDRETLGDYTGMAAAFLIAGASGVIAPLWSIDETVSRGIAERFYTRVFAGDSPAEVLRDERRHFQMTNRPKREPKSGTWMAYVFFGHPAMQLVRR